MTSMVLGIVVFVLVVLFFAGYGLLLLKVQGAIVFKWETTVIILFMHLQYAAPSA